MPLDLRQAVQRRASAKATLLASRVMFHIARIFLTSCTIVLEALDKSQLCTISHATSPLARTHAGPSATVAASTVQPLMGQNWPASGESTSNWPLPSLSGSIRLTRAVSPQRYSTSSPTRGKRTGCIAVRCRTFGISFSPAPVHVLSAHSGKKHVREIALQCPPQQCSRVEFASHARSTKSTRSALWNARPLWL